MNHIRRLTSVRTLCVLLCLAILTLTVSGAAAAPLAGPAGPNQPDFPPAIVRCDPSYAEGYTDGTISVDLYLEDTQNTYGLDVAVTFDTNIASVVDQIAYQPGVQVLPLYTHFVPGFIIRNVACHAGENTGDCAVYGPGTIWYAITQTFPTPPVNGSGPFAKVTFQPKTFGTFTMHFVYHKLSDPTGIQVPSTAQDCTIKFMSPLAVDLDSFTGAGAGNSVLLSWETVSETRLTGFNVLRAETAEGPWRQVNETLIPAVAPGASSGAVYAWEDRSVEPGRVYFYTLEDVGMDGVLGRNGPLAVDVQAPNAVSVSAFAGQPAFGWGWALPAALTLLALAYKRLRG